MTRTVLYADVLGFGSLSTAPGATGAADALSDLAYLLSSEDELAKLLRSSAWTERYGLSDSIFLVAEDPVQACAAAAELFFDLAYVNHNVQDPVLLRGAMTIGEVLRVKPIFRESATANLVGEAVVRAVRMEEARDSPKGPRLLLSNETATAWESSQPEPWLLSRNDKQQAELLWLLPPGPAFVNGLQIGEVCQTALSLAVERAANPSFGHHYLGYLDLVTRSLERLVTVVPEEGSTALKTSGLKEKAPQLESLVDPAESALLDRIRSLAK
jgi:class 3 adenylate cyclase